MKPTKKTSQKLTKSLPDEASSKTPTSKPAKSVPKSTPADKPTRPKPKSQNKPDKAQQVTQQAKKQGRQVTASNADLPSEVEIYHETLKHFLIKVVAFFGGFALAVLFAVIFSVILGINPLTE